MEKPQVIEVYADNGALSHYALIDIETGDKLWSEAPEECRSIGYPVKETQLEKLHSLGAKIAHLPNEGCVAFVGVMEEADMLAAKKRIDKVAVTSIGQLNLPSREEIVKQFEALNWELNEYSEYVDEKPLLPQKQKHRKKRPFHN